MIIDYKKNLPSQSEDKDKVEQLLGENQNQNLQLSVTIGNFCNVFFSRQFLVTATASSFSARGEFECLFLCFFCAFELLTICFGQFGKISSK